MRKRRTDSFGAEEIEKEAIERISYYRAKVHGRKPLSFGQIASRLNAEGFRTKKGLPFSYALVFHIWDSLRSRAEKELKEGPANDAS